ncbi:MAG TPA: MOSC domain-containing protein [Tepidisphaeraceae bacterium]|nr:MOSC domain-containing protein [Tepidisphaeraceae bacterium]
MMRLLTIQIGQPRTIVDEHGKSEEDRVWFSGFYKSPVTRPVRVGATGLAGDGQADSKHHGGADKAVLAYSFDHYPHWRASLGIDSFDPGAFGENLTVAGTNEDDVCVGDVWQIGEVRLQVSQPRQPCWKLARRWGRKDLPAQVIANGQSGWYLRVLREGTIQATPEAPMTIERVERPCLDWTIARINRLLYHDRDNPADRRALAACALLSESMRADFAVDQ